MTSIVSDFKQSHGYFITTAVGCVGYVMTTLPSGSGGSFGGAVMSALTGTEIVTPLALAGTILRDMGKTVTVGGIANTANTVTSAGTVGVPTRVFRKVQLLNTTRAVASASGAANAPNGVAGPAADNSTVAGMYDTFYVELPTLGRSGHTGNTIGQPLAYVNSLPGLYV